MAKVSSWGKINPSQKKAIEEDLLVFLKSNRQGSSLEFESYRELTSRFNEYLLDTAGSNARKQGVYEVSIGRVRKSLYHLKEKEKIFYRHSSEGQPGTSGFGMTEGRKIVVNVLNK